MEKRNSNDRFFIVNLQPPLAFMRHFAASPTAVQQELNGWVLAARRMEDLAWAQITFQFVPYIKNLEIKTTVTPRCASETFWDSNRMQTHH
uniref:Uncharacterized protein n=1 Tax=Oryza nivara TaxID=4536 RepID=A0A0E0HXI6_ORYNI